VVKGEVCKTSIQRFDPARRLHFPLRALTLLACRSGGTGRRSGLKIRGPQGRQGSNPCSGTSAPHAPRRVGRQTKKRRAAYAARLPPVAYLKERCQSWLGMH
jgi:hypothetical protein